MDKKIIFHMLGNSFSAFSTVLILPIFYAAIAMQNFLTTIFFSGLLIVTAAIGAIFLYLGRNHRRRLSVVGSALSMLLIYPVLSIIGVVPFLFFEFLSPIDAFLDTVSNLTSAGISLLPSSAPYVLRLWQSLLMWFGSLIFLILLVTVMPEVGGCFGVNMILQQGQNFSPLFGQMLDMTKRIVKVYSSLTLLSVILFKLAGLNSWDSILMAMRCISTGGGDFFPAKANLYVEYAAIFTMLTACGNFLFFYRLIYTLPPPISGVKQNIFRRVINYFKRLKQNIFGNIGNFFTNSEVKAILLIIFFAVGFIFLNTFQRGIIEDGNIAFRYAIFHVMSFMSTTGITLGDIDSAHDFDRFLVFMTAIFGGCMGSVTGGLKMMRVIVLAKVLSEEVKKTMHPHMLTSIRVNKMVVPEKIVGRILGFFFLCCITLFLCAAIFSLLGSNFSEAVAMSAACLTTVGILPGICDPSNFLTLSAAGKIFCMIVLIVGRVEIFALLLIPAGLRFRRKNKRW
ncbi:MAG: TrkH family potassium uptake protein [Selenomonadaceae bacterium]|nr:TrkH family potassium uptake protein [Selenomonadaceae bacterium]